MCSRLDRTAWRADSAAGDHLAAITARSQCAVLTMERYQDSEVFPHNEVLAFGCCSCSLWTSYTWDLGDGLRHVDHPARIAGSLPLDANGLHHLAPLLGFIGDELSEVGRRARKARTAQLSKPCLNLGIGKPRIDLFVERFDD